MTPKEIALRLIEVHKDDEMRYECNAIMFGHRLAKDYLALASEYEQLESHIAKLEAVAEAARKVMNICDKPWGELEASVWSILEDDYEAYHCRDLLFECLAELEQE